MKIREIKLRRFKAILTPLSSKNDSYSFEFKHKERCLSPFKSASVPKADLLNTTIHYYKRKNNLNPSSGKSYQSRSLTQFVVKALVWPISMVSQRLTNSSYQCDRYYRRQRPTIMPWLNGLMTNLSHYHLIGTQSLIPSPSPKS